MAFLVCGSKTLHMPKPTEAVGNDAEIGGDAPRDSIAASDVDAAARHR